jgi:ferredoxin
MNLNDSVYTQLAEKYRLSGDEHFIKILKSLMTPEEGQYLLALSSPMTPAQLAKKLCVDEQTAAANMGNLAKRGLLFRGKTQYIAWGDAHQLKARVMFSADEYIPREYLELRKKDNRYVSSPHAEIHGWFKIFERMGRPLIRVIPARQAIARSPAISSDQVLWHEDMAQLLRSAEQIGLVECDCRRLYGRCHKPLWTCLHFGRMVDYEVERGGRMKRISADEAVAITDEVAEAGLVHNTPGNFAALSGVICNCCNDCCSTFEPALQSGRISEIVAPSRFRAKVNAEACKGCQRCFKRCPFGAITMQPLADSRKSIPVVSSEKCLGCGVCVVGCQQGAMTFELVRPPEFIPPRPTVGQPLMYSVH